jgi:hypothetical protein
MRNRRNANRKGGFDQYHGVVCLFHGGFGRDSRAEKSVAAGPNLQLIEDATRAAASAAMNSANGDGFQLDPSDCRSRLRVRATRCAIATGEGCTKLDACAWLGIARVWPVLV